MEFVKIVFFISLICGLSAKLKLSAGTCVSKIVNGKLVQVGDCQKNDGSDIVRLIKKSRDEKKKTEIKCDFKYNSKCFRIVTYDVPNVTFNDAVSICKSMNIGEPANIYNLTHLQLLFTHLRPLVPAGWSGIDIWTGMEYKNNQLLLSSGENIMIATEVWYPNYPHPDASWTNVGVAVSKYPESIYHGVFHIYPSWLSYGVICEI